MTAPHSSVQSITSVAANQSLTHHKHSYQIKSPWHHHHSVPIQSTFQAPKPTLASAKDTPKQPHLISHQFNPHLQINTLQTTFNPNCQPSSKSIATITTHGSFINLPRPPQAHFIIEPS
jgi:hypothetical protein